jgi:transposase
LVFAKTTKRRRLPLAKDNLIEVSGGWEGYALGTVGRLKAGENNRTRDEVNIELLPIAGHPRRCSGCGFMVTSIHDVEERWVRELPLFAADCWLLVHRVRVLCPLCGPKLEDLPWLEAYARVTRRLADSVARLCKVLPLKHVAAEYGLNWKTVKAIDKEYLNGTLGPPDLEGLEQIVMDEFAIQKGHRYATVILEPATRRVLWVGRGRAREDIRPFFELLGPERCRKLKAVAMDMNAAYAEELKVHCPQAQVVYDLFHVVVKYGREVIDRVRVDEANRLRQDKPARQLIKGSRWLLLKNPDNIQKKEDRVRLRELLEANRHLMSVYVMKDDLKGLWDYRLPGAAMNFWRSWYARAAHSRIAPLIAFAKKLRGYLPGILSHCRWPLHTSVLEGVNNKIKVLKRMAYGFRDDTYFFLKIRAAFPGIGR